MTKFHELTEGYMAGSEENYSCDLGGERVKILMTTSMHSVVVYLILSTQNKQGICYIILYNIHVQCILLILSKAALSRHVRQCVHLKSTSINVFPDN